MLYCLLAQLHLHDATLGIWLKIKSAQIQMHQGQLCCCRSQMNANLLGRRVIKAVNYDGMISFYSRCRNWPKSHKYSKCFSIMRPHWRYSRSKKFKADICNQTMNSVIPFWGIYLTNNGRVVDRYQWSKSRHEKSE